MGGASGSLVVGGRSAQASNSPSHSPSPSFTGNANLSLGTPRSLALNITVLVRHAIRFLNLSHSVLTTSGVSTRASSARPTGQSGQGLDEHACPQSTHNDTSRQVYVAPNLTCTPAGFSSSQGTMFLAMTHSRAAFHQILSLLFLLFCNLLGGLVEGDRNVESPQARRESGTYGTNLSRRSTALGDVNLTPESAGESLKTPEPPSPAGKEALRAAGLNGLQLMPNKSALPIRFVSIRRATGEPG
jgi:hypothetical protein